GRVGEPFAMTATVSGSGNVALWPEPAIHWPRGFRPYPGETGMRITPRDGRIAGTKVFHYLVMPDSAGSFLLPEVRYPYYDLAAGEYRTATVAPRALAVAPGIEPHAAPALPSLARDRGRQRGGRPREAPARPPARFTLRAPRSRGCGRARGGARAGVARVERRDKREGAPARGGDAARGRRGARWVRCGPDAECGSAVRRGGAPRRGGLVRGARGGGPARAGALV